MITGLSTACFYPLETEESLKKVGELGFRSTEVFFNSTSELKIEFLNELKNIKDYYDINICSLHPMASFAEPYMLFSSYKRRYYDSLELYKHYFQAANILGSNIIVIHGNRAISTIENEEYFERFSELIDLGSQNGVIVAHENVVNTWGYSPKNMIEMGDYIGDKFKIVFDIKQSVRSGYDPFEFINKLKDRIIHIHISDHDEINDCLPPCEGIFDFKKLFDIMDSSNYKGEYIIELYKDSFLTDKQLIDSYNSLLPL